DVLPRALAELVAIPGLPPLALPEPWREEVVTPEVEAVFAEPKPRMRHVVGQVFFHYPGGRFAVGSRESGLVDELAHRVVRRDQEAERTRILRLAALGVRRAEESEDLRVQVLQEHLPGLVRQLVQEGWRVEASGRRMRGLSSQSLQLSSGVDWFELSGELDFEGVSAGLPELLEAIKSGSRFVRLGDGSEGMLPESWLERYSALANLGSKKAGKLRFASSQAILLDLLLEGQGDVAVDEGFERARATVDRNARVEALEEPEGFVGTLRDYQRLGLGWQVFLRKVGLGGCLADDMGLGKTVQVLAMLAMRKREAIGRPSLVVAPRSLIHNWMDEARRFVPDLKVLAFVGPERHEALPELPSYDLVITTYGTLRRDVEALSGVALDYVILDEAQAIKNAGAQASKAVRLLQGEHRLALSGTPVENHLAELWSIFEFLNPRMLGARRDFASLARPEQRGALTRVARGLAPLILRRTKDQVLSELPAKTELTVFCEPDEDEARRYRELRDHLRRSLTERVERDGMGRAKIHVLEALLRLRQAACHPGLLDEKRRKQGSAKIDTLLAHLTEVLEEGHKALVFSQFVQLLSIVRERLDAEGISYAYLDGSTKDREAVVRSFQEGSERSVFLISLRAGGLGLNLTEADYVYILDPWWNPAVEAQAIDRAHRIGQTRPVFAYRLIAQGTVEEKIQALQAEKMELAEAIVSSHEGLIERLTLDDLRGLLS
ncbi:MAG: SNF2 helicase associated domain-containing protein, partial [Deltaproteobacteria bacterium]|nr:SNF2 helicase associated domain-containing protein [Deltaproteobacteria bacterium]